MPIYEYVCNTCGTEFEAIQKFSDAPLTAGACGHEGSAERKMSLAAFQLKGGGWYKDKYSGGGNGATASTTTASESKGSEPAASAASAHACGGACSCG